MPAMRRVRIAANAKIKSGARASAIDAFTELTCAQPMKTHHAMTEVPTGPSHAIAKASRRLTAAMRARPRRVAHATRAIAEPAIAKRRKERTAGDTPHSRVSAEPMTNVEAKPSAESAARTSPMIFSVRVMYSAVGAGAQYTIFILLKSHPILLAVASRQRRLK